MAHTLIEKLLNESIHFHHKSRFTRAVSTPNNPIVHNIVFLRMKLTVVFLIISPLSLYI